MEVEKRCEVVSDRGREGGLEGGIEKGDDMGGLIERG